MDNSHSEWNSSEFPFVVRPVKLDDVNQVMSVLRNAAFSNIMPAVRVTFRGRGFRLVASSIIFLVYMTLASVLAAALCFLLIVFLVWLFNLLVALFYSYGPPLQDMKDVKTNYMSDPRTRFWVVQVKTPDGITDIVGCIAIVNKLPNSHVKTEGERCDVAFLRRLAVRTEFRGCGFAKTLVKTAIDFCRKHQYDRIDLITTDIHSAAKQLYTTMGFSCLGLKLYKYYGGIIRIWTYEYTYNLGKSAEASSR